jgi:hypothetical protein
VEFQLNGDNLLFPQQGEGVLEMLVFNIWSSVAVNNMLVILYWWICKCLKSGSKR